MVRERRTTPRGVRAKVVRVRLCAEDGAERGFTADEAERLALALAGCDAAVLAYRADDLRDVVMTSGLGRRNATSMVLEAQDHAGNSLFELRIGLPRDADDQPAEPA